MFGSFEWPKEGMLIHPAVLCYNTDLQAPSSEARSGSCASNKKFNGGYYKVVCHFQVPLSSSFKLPNCEHDGLSVLM
jgi:hypothetical protein